MKHLVMFFYDQDIDFLCNSKLNLCKILISAKLLVQCNGYISISYLG